jgi:hypothetical protein
MKDMKTVEIDGDSYKIQCFQTSRSLKVLTRLIKMVLGPAAAAAFTTGGGKLSEILDKELDKGISDAIVRLADRLDEKEVLALFLDFASCAFPEVGSAGSCADDFETRFAGRLMHLIKLSVEVVRHNYEDFFGEGSALRSFVQKRAATIPAIPLSTGSSGSRS